MGGELDNMKKMDHTTIQQMIERPLSMSPVRVIFECKYEIQAEDGTVLYQESWTQDVSNLVKDGKQFIEWALVDRLAWANTETVKDAKKKYGKH